MNCLLDAGRVVCTYRVSREHPLLTRSVPFAAAKGTLSRPSTSSASSTSRRSRSMRATPSTTPRCVPILACVLTAEASREAGLTKARDPPSSAPARTSLDYLQRFAAVIMRIREPKTTALVFASGKVVVTGAKSEDDSRLAARKFARIIQKLGFETKFTDFKIQNIVGSVRRLAFTRCSLRLPPTHSVLPPPTVRRQVPDPSRRSRLRTRAL